ncbi:hypothetical protein GJT93_01515 [Enterobacteriaceae endosymbiont of Donacia provostii]|uniref:hypothetical protein n=1 Tax=Enterobacteriaceae endosymbiont of Donacia provostii TaxID=2675781 RepID=UPI001449FA61|nr:hypothetical protein [Enterobacteriaceae endosymbiont of Donacia provostii]QJC33775.1 hypothetical protein GJT93_01515 [Enterobacteriaceae endosymbiont of Donacia provostii]
MNIQIIELSFLFRKNLLQKTKNIKIFNKNIKFELINKFKKSYSKKYYIAKKKYSYKDK